jgi:pimeloyl-ACP methyl ester carboxylesterase
MTLRCLWPLWLVISLVLLAQGPAGAASHTHVYLLRGISNVSVGLDALAAKLGRLGVETSVSAHDQSVAVASEAIRAYKSGKINTIVLIGHSLGGAGVLSMADTLNEAGVPVALLIALDPTSSGPVAANVHRAVNFYIEGAQLTAGPGFRGSLQNINFGNIPGMDHMTVQSMSTMHQKMINLVVAARGNLPAAAYVKRN